MLSGAGPERQRRLTSWLFPLCEIWTLFAREERVFVGAAVEVARKATSGRSAVAGIMLRRAMLQGRRTLRQGRRKGERGKGRSCYKPSWW